MGFILMSRTGIDYDSVKQAAIKLLSQGAAPSVQRVRELLGTGSNTTIAEHLKLWREEHAKKTIHHLPATLPKELIATFEVLWQTAMEHAQNHLAAQKQALDQERAALEQRQHESDKAMEQLKQHAQASATELAQATADIQQCHIELAVMSERLEKQIQACAASTEQYEARLKHAYAQKDELVLQHQHLQEALKTLQEQLNVQAQQFQHIQTRQATLHEQSENRWLQTIDKTRQEAKDNQKKLEKLCDTKEAQIKNLTLSVSELQQNLFEKNAVLNAALEQQKALKQEIQTLKAAKTSRKKVPAEPRNPGVKKRKSIKISEKIEI